MAADADQVQLVFHHLQPLSEHDRGRLEEFARVHNFQVLLQPSGPDTVEALYPLEPELYLHLDLDGDIRIGSNALDIVQVNRDINRRMVAQALDLLELQPEHKVLVLFCGLGNFTLPLARRCAQVTGVEVDAAMLRRARAATLANRIENTEYFSADLSQPDPDVAWMGWQYDRILLDPPRSGALEMVQTR